eukprot:COSAG06_NODE_35611_length_458_cov_0.532033_1_plen_85_part_10
MNRNFHVYIYAPVPTQFHPVPTLILGGVAQGRDDRGVQAAVRDNQAVGAAGSVPPRSHPGPTPVLAALLDDSGQTNACCALLVTP